MPRTTRLLTMMLAVTCFGAVTFAEDIYYYQGQHRVDLKMALDELDLRLAPGADPQGVALPAAGFLAPRPLGRIETVDRSVTRYRCAERADLDSLMRLADQLRRAPQVRDVHPVGYDSPEALAARDPIRRYVLTCEFVARLHSGQDPEQIAQRDGVTLVRRLPIGDDLYLFAAQSELDAVDVANGLRETGRAVAAQPVIRRRVAQRSIPDDPLYPDQWHLDNTGQGGGTPGVDLNVESAWGLTRGAGPAVAIVDDGLEIAHPDLAPNHDDSLAYDYNDDDPDPTPTCYQSHGTAVAGLAAARGYNGLGVSSVAPEATLVGIRLLGAPHTDVEEGLALAHHNDVIAVYNNSWGPSDNGATKLGPGVAAGVAIEEGIASGRDGKGCIFVWAAGNGGTQNDNANYDGYVNSRYTIAVTAITDADVKADFAEPGACTLVNAPSSGGSSALLTTDLTGECGYWGDYRNFGGTSGTSPQGAGVVALMLAANDELTWRGVQHILVHTAAKNDPDDPGWATNGAGHEFNHKYGFGRLDASAAVQAAQTWVNRPAEVYAEYTVSPALPIPDDDPGGASSQIILTEDINCETVEIPVDISTLNRGDLRIELESPDGTVSVLAHSNHDGNNHYDWTFTSVQHWDEHSVGTWTLRVIDEQPDNLATLNSWTLRVWGTPGCPQPTGDIDLDCDVDLEDFAEFAVCFTSSGVTTPPPSCSDQAFNMADIDDDGDVDLSDFATFALVFTN